MSDGKSIGKVVGEAVTNAGKAVTVDLAKDIFEQIMSGSSTSTNDDQSEQGALTPHQKVMQHAQKNARMAQIMRNIQRIKKERDKVRKEVQEKEQARLKQIEDQKQAVEQHRQEQGLAHKTSGLFKNMSNFIARKGKGEQRGAKIAG
jgi:hypothetical protein